MKRGSALNKKPLNKRIGVLSFPGTQCDRDVLQALGFVGYGSELLWYADHFSYRDYAAFILPGGFSYGDYLRAGSLAAHSSAMGDIREAARAGVPILGICNGFQILCEAGLLGGTLQINEGLRFIDEWVELELCHVCSIWSVMPSRVRIPIAHREGRFYASGEEMKKLEGEGLIWWKYLKNPNGSLGSIAGLMNGGRNVAGLMPHPERAMVDWMGGMGGVPFFSQL